MAILQGALLGRAAVNQISDIIYSRKKLWHIL